MHKTKSLHWSTLTCLVLVNFPSNQNENKTGIITAHAGVPRSHLEKSEKLIPGHVRIYSGRSMKASHVVWVQGGKSLGNWVWTDAVLGCERNRLEFEPFIRINEWKKDFFQVPMVFSLKKKKTSWGRIPLYLHWYEISTIIIIGERNIIDLER